MGGSYLRGPRTYAGGGVRKFGKGHFESGFANRSGLNGVNGRCSSVTACVPYAWLRVALKGHLQFLFVRYFDLWPLVLMATREEADEVGYELSKTAITISIAYSDHGMPP